MKRILISLATVAVAATICLAQGFSTVQPKEFFLFIPEVQKEIDFTSAQISKIKEAAGDAISFTPEGRLQLRISHDSKSPNDIATDISKVLDAKQTKRLEEIWIQKIGLFTLSNEGIAKRVQLSSAQKSKVNAILDAYGDEIRRELMSSGGRLEMKDMDGVKAGFAKQLEALLEPKQKQAFEAMKGKPFKFAEHKKPKPSNS